MAASAECVVGDKVTVSITTAGNQIREAKGMEAEVKIDNVHLDGNDESKGTIGALDAAITWSSNGVMQSMQDAIPVLSSFVSGVTTTRRTARSSCRARWAAASSPSRMQSREVEFYLANTGAKAQSGSSTFAAAAVGDGRL